MSKQEYQVIHREDEQNMEIEVIDEGDFRSLVFAKKYLQSRIYRPHPYRLILPYSQYMMFSLCLLPHKPEHILLIGIGGGAIITCLQHHFPKCHIVVVDSSARVIALARRFFGLRHGSQTTVYQQDGLVFMQHQARRQHYDLILVDAFTGDGMAESVYTSTLFTHAQAQLKPHGLVCCNLWSSNRSHWRQLVRELRAVFPGTLFAPVPERGNIISYSPTKILSWQNFAQLRPQIDQTAQLLELDCRKMLSIIEKNNLNLYQRIASKLFQLFGSSNTTQHPRHDH